MTVTKYCDSIGARLRMGQAGRKRKLEKGEPPKKRIKSEIIETQKFKEIFNYLNRKSLLLLDVDNTLMETMQTLGSDQWFNWRIGDYVKKGLPRQEALEVALMEWVSVQCLTKVKKVEPNTDKLVERIQKEGFRVMGLTTRGASLATRTCQQLKSIGIDLSKTAPTKDEVVFLNPRECIYKNGILFTSGTHKGEAFKNFISLIKLNDFEEVIFKNDRRAHLEQLAEACQQLGKKFIGLRYGYLDEKVKNLDEDVARWQFKKFGTIKSDEEAHQHFKHKETERPFYIS